MARLNSSAAMRSRRFTPFKPPTSPPAGMYDPMLDSQQAAAQRGYGDLQSDTNLQGGRSLSDYLISLGRARQQQGYGLADIAQQRQREGQDYGFRTSELQRNFRNLAASQTDRANAMGVAGSSGWDQGAAGVRNVNQARQQGQYDQAHQRFLTDEQTRENRLNAGEQFQEGQLGLQYQRAGQDRSTQLGRSGRELGFFGNDINAAKFYQAENYGGYVPPTAPQGQATRNGITYQRNPNGTATLSSGRMVSGRGLRGLLARRRGL